MAEWYYAVGGDRRGPVSADQIRAMLGAGTIDRATLVWASPMTDWQPLGQTELGAGTGSAAHGFAAGAPAAPATGWAPAPGWSPQAPATASAPPVIGFGDAVRAFFAKYVTFDGRASRPEFWYAVLFMILVSVVASIVDMAIVGGATGFQPLSSLATLVFFLPSISVAVRRLHDTDRSGWWYLILFVPLIGIIALIVFWCQKGTEGPNRFG